MKRVALLSLGSLLAAAVEAGPIHWVPVGPPGNPVITVLAIAKPNRSPGAPSPPSILFAGTAAATVFRSDNSGLAWSSTGLGLTADAVTLTARQFNVSASPINEIYETTVFAGTSGSGIFRLAPNATSWLPANAGLTSLDVKALLADANGVVYAGTADGIFASTDGGDSWWPKGMGLPSGADGVVWALAADPSAASTLYAGTTGGLFKSTNSGASWFVLNTGSSFKVAVSTIVVDPLAPSRIYAAGIASPPCAPLCLAPSFPTALRSLDGGMTWTTMGGLAGSFVRAFAATSNLPAAVFAGAAGGGVFRSLDGGATWVSVNDGLGDAAVSSLVIDPVLPSLIFAGTAKGVFCAPLGQVALTCSSGGQTLCLNAHRFSIAVLWRDASHSVGAGQALPITDNTGAFWFFDPTNLELVVKVLDGRSVNGKFWVFYGALTNVEYTITVADTLTGAVKTYFNSQGQLASAADTGAF